MTDVTVDIFYGHGDCGRTTLIEERAPCTSSVLPVGVRAQLPTCHTAAGQVSFLNAEELEQACDRSDPYRPTVCWNVRRE
jgi:hypothetical protein